MSAGRASFEIQTFRNGHWSTEEFRETESAGRACAKKLFSATPPVQGVRVVKNWARADGQITETVVFTQMRESNPDQVRIVAIETANVCRQPADYFSQASRMTIGRLLRNYLEQAVMTPTELLHNYRALKRIQDTDSLYPSAVDRVATVQSRITGDDSRERRDELYRAVDQMSVRALRAERMRSLPRLDDDFAKVVEEVSRFAEDDEDRDYYSLVVLSNDLITTRNWLGKLERLTRLSGKGLPPASMSLLDGVIADLLGVPSALQDVLGHQRSLAAALIQMVDLSEGVAKTSPADSPQLEVLNGLFAAGLLPACRAALLDRVQRQLASAQPLDRAGPGSEDQALRRVLARLVGPEGVCGGPDVAAALVLRFARSLEQGGRTGQCIAIGGILNMIRMPDVEVMFLVELLRAQLGRDHGGDVLKLIHDTVHVRDLEKLVPAKLSPKDKMVRATRLHRFLMASHLPEDMRQGLADHIDDLLARYLLREGVIEKLDKPDSPLRQRAIMLVQFCAAGVLPEGKALKLARERVVSHLRRPDFEKEFVTGLDATAQARSLRAFYSLLGRAGFH